MPDQDSAPPSAVPIPPTDYQYEQIDVSEFFDSTNSESVDFETIFAATVASLVLTSYQVTSGLHVIAKLGAAILLISTLARRLAISGDFSREDAIMSNTIRPILYSTFFGLLYLILGFSIQATEGLPIGWEPMFGLFLFTAALSIVIAYEYLYRDFTIWTLITFYNVYVQNRTNFFGESLGKSMVFLASSGIVNLRRFESLIERLLDYDVQGGTSAEYIGSFVGVGLALCLASILCIAGAVPLRLATSFGWITSILLGLPVGLGILALSGVVQFSYARHGYSRYNEFASWKDSVVLAGLTYSIVFLI